jgi:hypothetical protein
LHSLFSLLCFIALAKLAEGIASLFKNCPEYCSNSSCVFKTAIGYRFICLQATVFLLVAVGVSVKAGNIQQIAGK